MKLSHVFTFLGGVAAGALVGILFAPDKGSNTRQYIIDALKDKGIIMSKSELEAFVQKVKSKLNMCYTEEDMEAAVADTIDEERI